MTMMEKTEVIAHSPMVTTNSPAPIAILENGDRLSRQEFERIYTASGIKKAELIEGIVHVASPLRHTYHGQPHSAIITWLGTYQAQRNDLAVSIEATVRLDDENELQPDGILFRLEGSAHIDEDEYISGAPELVVEIAASTASYDLHSKKRVYESHGVREYIVWRTLDRKIDWFVLSDGKYERLSPDDNGLIISQEFPGLVLNTPAMLANNMAEVIATINNFSS
ncbi:Uma2 family endonuclease [Synechocystis sp. LEGE 06083]|nr:Uma2 family endonuclease [Synechocystis sp. LEGE 06083]